MKALIPLMTFLGNLLFPKYGQKPARGRKEKVSDIETVFTASVVLVEACQIYYIIFYLIWFLIWSNICISGVGSSY